MNRYRSIIYKHFNHVYFFLKPYRKTIVLILVITPFAAFFEYITIAIFLNISNILAGSSSALVKYGALFDIIQSIIGVLPISNPIVSAAVFLVFAACIKTIGLASSSYLASSLSQKVRIDLQNSLACRYLNARYEFYMHAKQGDMVFNITQAPTWIGIVIKMVPSIFIAFIRGLFLTALLCTVSLKTTCIIGSLGIVFWGVLTHYSKKIGYVEGERANRALSGLTVTVNEFISGIKIVKAYLIEMYFSEGIRRHSENFFQAKMKYEKYRIVLLNVLEFGLFFLFSLLLSVASIYKKEIILSLLPRLIVYVMAVYKLVPIMNSLGENGLDYMHYFPTLELLKTELLGTKTAADSDGSVVVSHLGRIEFQNVTFGYGMKEVLNHLSFCIESKEVTAIVGRSGVGKTTIVNLMLRLYRPSEGMLTINGISLNEINKTSYFTRIAYVSQNPILFNDTITANITVGFNDIDSVRLKEVAQLTYIDEFVENLPHGYDTLIGDMGAKLSGGQKQRICLARALYRDPDLIILDEAISSLDNISQNLIMKTVESLVHKKTFLIISHRISTIRMADKIIVLDNGMIVGEGKHDELVRKSPLYNRLYSEEQHTNE